LKQPSCTSEDSLTKASSGIGFIEFILLMAMMMSLTALSIDAMMPALPVIGNELAVLNPNDNHLIISALFFGLAIGQLFYGPISDSIGRKQPLYWGLILFIIGSLISIAASNLAIMLLGRTVQGFGLASPRTLSLAMIRDQFEGRKMAQVMSFTMMIFILVPTLAPAMGQVILYVANWRAIFVVFMMMALLILIWFWSRMQETLAAENRIRFSIKRINNTIVEIGKDRVARTYMLAAGFVSAPFIAFLNTSQQIFQGRYELGTLFPLYFACIALTFGLASFFNAKMVLQHGMQKMIKVAVVALVVISIVFLLLVSQLTGQISLSLAMTYLITTLFCEGILFGNLNSLAMEPLGQYAGIGSSVVGASSTFISVCFGTLISMQYDGTILPIVFGFLFFGIISMYLIFWID
jgi:DHA1 family bicyclomycin/chloramphenicol resistance-like MFS transporter